MGSEPNNSDANANADTRNPLQERHEKEVRCLYVEKLTPPDRSSAIAAIVGALGLVFWVFVELEDSHGVLKLIVLTLVVAAFTFVACHESVKLWHRGKFIWALGAIFQTIVIITATRNVFVPNFTIIPRDKAVETKKPRYFLRWNLNGREILSPINVIMRVQFTNLRDKAMAINSYQFEGHTTNGTWEIMPTIDVKAGELFGYVGTNWGAFTHDVILGPAKEGDAAIYTSTDGAFPEVLYGTIIPPGGSIEGTVYLETTKRGFDGPIRCRLRDSTDQEFVELVSPAKEPNALEARIHRGAGGAAIARSGKDFKDIPIIPWSQAWPPGMAH